MKTRWMGVAAGALGAVLAAGSMVGAEAGVNQRQKRQQGRILQGVKSGELTRNEFRRLEKEQARIRRHERKARSDGEFTLKERARINRELNRSSRHIYRQKHDRQDRN